jgi:hypothetical protein
LGCPGRRRFQDSICRQIEKRPRNKNSFIPQTSPKLVLPSLLYE